MKDFEILSLIDTLKRQISDKNHIITQLSTQQIRTQPSLSISEDKRPDLNVIEEEVGDDKIQVKLDIIGEGLASVSSIGVDEDKPKKKPPSNGVIPYSELSQYQRFPCLYMEGFLMKARAPSRLFTRSNVPSAGSGFFSNLHKRFFSFTRIISHLF